MNETLKNSAKEILKELLNKCTEPQQRLFKQMYCFDNMELPINEVIEQMDGDNMDWAITQCERTVKKNQEP